MPYAAQDESRPEAPWARDFLDPANELRRLFSEVLGTFFLVLVAVGAGVVGAASGVPISRAAAVTAPGLILMAIILSMGKVGGAHLNPVVSLAFALGRPGTFGATVPAPAISDVQAMLFEAVLTLGLVSVILGTASSAQNVGSLSAIAVGGYIALAGLWASPISGASMNPVRSLAPDLVRGDFSHAWVYLVGPVLGSLLAVAFAFALRGRGGDTAAIRAAKGD
jgi:aquaporin Z